MKDLNDDSIENRGYYNPDEQIDDDEQIEIDDELYDEEESEEDFEENFEEEEEEKEEKKVNNYYDEERMTYLLIEFQKSLKFDEDGKIISRNETVENEIVKNLENIAKAIIYRYSYQRFEPVDELTAEAVSAMWKYIPKFDPTKGKSFGLFSNIAKKHLLNITYKGYKVRLMKDVDITPEAHEKESYKKDVFFLEDMEKIFYEIIEKKFKEKEKEYKELTAILINYIEENKVIVGKKDLYLEFKKYGYKTSQYKKFIENISQYKNEIYEQLK